MRPQGLSLLARLAEAAAASSRSCGLSTGSHTGPGPRGFAGMMGWARAPALVATTLPSSSSPEQQQQQQHWRRAAPAAATAAAGRAATSRAPAPWRASVAGSAIASLGGVGGARHATTAAATTAPSLLRLSCPPLFLLPNYQHHQNLQQLRGAKAAAKGGGKKGGAAGGKKGASAAGGAAKKKAKLRIASKPFDEKHPLNQRLVAMLLPPKPASASAPVSEEQEQEARDREREYARRRRGEFNAWRAGLGRKLALKRAALDALPAGLRVEALKEDLAPFPLARNALFDAPPSAYLEEQQQFQKGG